MGKLLIVDDEPHMRQILSSNLRHEGHEVIEAGCVGDARRALSECRFEAVVTDQKMGDGEGLDVLSTAHEMDPALAVVFLTAFATIELAVESMRRGSFDFITKPFAPEVLIASASRAVERTRLLRENGRLRDTVLRLEGSSEITGRSPAISQLRQKIARVAPTNATVLITGETGTGKELVARAVHSNSSRASKPLIAVNCAAFTETLLESELFGHERGAFTGADRPREGLFEAAHEGTLFLDEAGELSMPAQAKLLRVLTDGQVTRIGSTKPRQVDVRLMVATHRDLGKRVQDGLFREDLYYRLNVVTLRIAPLRERTADIPDLVRHFIRKHGRDHAVTQETMDALLEYPWPGNVRELEHCIQHMVAINSGPLLHLADLPTSLANYRLARQPRAAAAAANGAAHPCEPLPPSASGILPLHEVERQAILRALEYTKGDRVTAAALLGIGRTTLYRKLKEYALPE
jgi:two-component system response regulator HydG